MNTAQKIAFLLMLNATLGMTGLCWFLRLMHYPLFIRAGRTRFPAISRTTFSILPALAGPLMLVELGSALMLAFAPPVAMPRELTWAGLLLLSAAWGVTVFHHRPAARSLMRGFDPAAFRALLCAQWARTYAWSFRAVVALLMLLRILSWS